jgi:hypothetical protein
MTLLKKEETVFERDENGELIPELVELKSLRKQVDDLTKPIKENDKVIGYEKKTIPGPMISAIPMTRGETKKLFSEAMNKETSNDHDRIIVLKNCLDPKYTEEDFDKEKIKPWATRS